MLGFKPFFLFSLLVFGVSMLLVVVAASAAHIRVYQRAISFQRFHFDGVYSVFMQRVQLCATGVNCTSNSLAVALSVTSLSMDNTPLRSCERHGVRYAFGSGE